MKQKEIISKENLEKLGFTRRKNDGGPGGVDEYYHKDCSFIKITCFLSVWHLELSSIHGNTYAKYSGTKTWYELADFNPQNNARYGSHPELTSNDEIIGIMLKWLEGALKHQQERADYLKQTYNTIKQLI